MFNENLLNVLKQVNSITNSIILKYPTSVAVSRAQDILVQIPISEIDSEEFIDIPLVEKLDRFLSLFKLFPESSRKVEISDNILSISNNKNKADFVLSDLVLLEEFNKDTSQFTKTESVPSVADFDLTVNDIKQIRDAISVFKDLEDITFASKDGELSIKLNTTSKFNALTDAYSIEKEANVKKNFEVTLTVENFLKIPVSDYHMSIKFNEARNSYRFLLSNKNLETFKIIMSCKVS